MPFRLNTIREEVDRLTKDLHWKGNVYVALGNSVLLAMSLFMVCRFAFFLYNLSFFPDMSLTRMARIAFGGLRFDLAAVLYLNLLFILLLILPLRLRFRSGYQRLLKWIFLATNTLGLAANVADTVYYRFTLRRTTLSVLKQFENEQNLPGLLGQFLLDFWYAPVFLGVLVYAMYFFYLKIRIAGPQVRSNPLYYGAGIIAMLVSAGLVVAGIRGGFGESTRPITISNAAQYATVPKDINLVLNTPFALLRTARTPIVEKVKYFDSDAMAEAIYSPVHLPRDTASFTSRNVVVIILESFSLEFTGAYNQEAEGGAYKGYTPFLDSLVRHSRAFKYPFANGRKSIDAMPSVICSIPAIEVPFVLSHFSGNRVTSLAELLKEKGYYTAFFHGAPNGSMGFQAFANSCGFEDYFGRDEYDNDADYDGIWGIWDHKFLDFYADKMNMFKEPFYTNFFSVSSHHPYNLPEELSGSFKGGEMSIYRCIEYTDYALRKFFTKAQTMPWYKNTLFVIAADHASAQIRLKEYNTAWGYFSVPVFFYEPGSTEMKMEEEIVQQIDIMPTVLGLLRYDKPYVAFGRNILDRQSRPTAFNYLDNTYQSFRGDYLLQFDGERSIGLFDFRNDRLLSTNLQSSLPDTLRSMEIELKAFLQQYKNRMVDDNLTMSGSLLPSTRH